MTDGPTAELPIYPLPGFYEPFSAISHLFGAVVFLYLGALVLRRGRGDWTRLIFLGIYTFACVFLLSMSGVYHMMDRGGMPRRVMERLDHGAIFVLIAGTFTPTHGLLFRGYRRWLPLVLIWSAAITGITLKTIFFETFAEWLGLTFYLTMGWFGTITAYYLVQQHGFSAIKPLVYGGLAYSLGGVFDYLHWFVVIPGVVQPHELFHIAVLVGAFIHWTFVWRIVTGEFVGLDTSLIPGPEPRSTGRSEVVARRPQPDQCGAVE